MLQIDTKNPRRATKMQKTIQTQVPEEVQPAAEAC